eukprot:scaffold282253_cov29-Tisochrysis_lutea.AAC.5
MPRRLTCAWHLLASIMRAPPESFNVALAATAPCHRVDIDSIATDSGFSETTFDGIGFGLGVSVIIDPIKASLLCSKGEFGWGGWASTFFAVDPEEEMVIMSLAQLAPSDRYPLRRQLRCLVYQALLN